MGGGLTVKTLLPHHIVVVFSHHDLQVFTTLAFTLRKYYYLLRGVAEEAIDNTMEILSSMDT
jgi:hypothetical protein